MKSILMLFSLLFAVSSAFSQSAESLLNGGDDKDSRHAIQNFKSTPVVQGYRICLFVGSNQNARTEAKQTLELCYSSFPDIDGEIVYEAPIFKVLVGACIDRIESTRLLARLQPSFPKAFIMSCSMPVTDFLTKEVTDSSLVNKEGQNLDF